LNILNWKWICLLAIVANSTFTVAAIAEQNSDNKQSIPAELVNKKLDITLSDELTKNLARLKGNLYSQLFFDGENKILWKSFDSNLQSTYGSLENFNSYQKTLMQQLGSHVETLNSRVFLFDKTKFYERLDHYQNLDTNVALTWHIDQDNNIMHHEVRLVPKEADSEYLDYITKTDLTLPFKAGQNWLVFWGGHSTYDNYHADTSSQRFAYDFFVTNQGKYYEGDGSQNEDHFCFGQSIVSPGSGVIVEMVKDIHDNNPGIENTEQPYGNYIIIDHANGEYSIMGHFKQDSLIGAIGDYVLRGEYLGDCGNSGFSDLPHLHYHLANMPILNVQTLEQYNKLKSFPTQFNHYYSNQSPIARGEPARGETIFSEHNFSSQQHHLAINCIEVDTAYYALNLQWIGEQSSTLIWSLDQDSIQPIESPSERCASTNENLDIMLPFSRYAGNISELHLNRYHHPNHASGFYWSLDSGKVPQARN